MKKRAPHPRSLGRNMLNRLSRIQEQIQSGTVSTQAQLAAKEGVTRKTILSDIAYLRSRGHEIERDRFSGFWKYQKPPPGVKLSEDEMFALLVAEKVVGLYRGTPFELPLRRTFSRFSGEKSTKFGVSWDDVRKGISFKSTGLTNTGLDIYKTVVDSISGCWEIQFMYRGAKDTIHRQRRLRPYHMCCVNGQWYLLGYDFGSSKEKTFALTRMKSAKLLATKFSPPDEKAIQRQFESSMGIFMGAEPISIVLDFDSMAALWVQERHWHESQQFEPIQKGGTRMTLCVVDSPEVDQWILGYAEHVTVQSPSWLRDRILNRLKASVANYL